MVFIEGKEFLEMENWRYKYFEFIVENMKVLQKVVFQVIFILNVKYFE